MEPSLRLLEVAAQQRLIAAAHAKGETVYMSYTRDGDPPGSFRTYPLPPALQEV